LLFAIYTSLLCALFPPALDNDKLINLLHSGDTISLSVLRRLGF